MRRPPPTPDMHDATPRTRLRTARLDCLALDADDLDALIAADADTLRARLGAAFDAPIVAPEHIHEHLADFAAALRANPGDVGWLLWLWVRRDGGEAVGMAGLGRPDDDGAVTFGYSVYERHQRNGYATEALRALLDEWIFAEPAARVARATIPPWNVASLRVAEKLGMRAVGRENDPEVGEVIVYERERDGG